MAKLLSLPIYDVAPDEEPVDPVIPDPEAVDEVMAEPELPLSKNVEFDYSSYIPGDGKQETGIYYVLFVIIVLSLLILSLFIVHGSSSSSNGLPVYSVDLDVSVDKDAYSRSVLFISDSVMQDPCIRLYKNNKVVSVNVQKLDRGYSIVLPEAGEYIVHLVSGSEDSIYYGLSFVSVAADIDYAGLTKVVSDYVVTIKDRKKKTYTAQLSSIFSEAAAIKSDDIDSLVESIETKTRAVLGFDDMEQKVDSENEWQLLLDYNGVIDKYLTDNNITIDVNNYSAIFDSIAKGLLK